MGSDSFYREKHRGLRIEIPKDVGKQYVVWPDKLRRWKDRHAGERCFIVGNGPSLRETPLERLTGEYSFALNSIAKIYDKTAWRPTFYVNTTGMVVCKTWAEHARTSVALGIPSFLAVQYIPCIYMPPVPDNVELVVISEGHVSKVVTPPDKWWSHDIGQRICVYGTTMLAIMQIAAFMGFKEFVLVGCDMGWKPFDFEQNRDPNHFDEDYWESATTPDGSKRVVTDKLARRFNVQCEAAHQLTKRITDKLGIKVYNATTGGELEVYPRVDLDKVLAL